MIEQKLQQLQQVIDGAVGGGLFKSAAMAIAAQNALSEVVQYIRKLEKETDQLEVVFKEVARLQEELRELKSRQDSGSGT